MPNEENAMLTTAPAVVQQYLDAAAIPDDDALVSCFTSDASVLDDGRTYRGRAEIRAWREELASSFDYTVQVIDAVETGESQHLVSTRVAGNFPGSPVELRYRFTLAAGLIDRLEIAP